LEEDEHGPFVTIHEPQLILIDKRETTISLGARSYENSGKTTDRQLPKATIAIISFDWTILCSFTGKCKHVKCELGNWTEWSATDFRAGSCGEQVRTQSYKSEVVFSNQVDNCNGLATVCPADKQEKRTICK